MAQHHRQLVGPSVGVPHYQGVEVRHFFSGLALPHPVGEPVKFPGGRLLDLLNEHIFREVALSLSVRKVHGPGQRKESVPVETDGSFPSKDLRDLNPRRRAGADPHLPPASSLQFPAPTGPSKVARGKAKRRPGKPASQDPSPERATQLHPDHARQNHASFPETPTGFCPKARGLASGLPWDMEEGIGKLNELVSSRLRSRRGGGFGFMDPNFKFSATGSSKACRPIHSKMEFCILSKVSGDFQKIALHRRNPYKCSWPDGPATNSS